VQDAAAGAGSQAAAGAAGPADAENATVPADRAAGRASPSGPNRAAGTGRPAADVPDR
jgi:hypothetical protein